MTILSSRSRAGRQMAAPSVREVCLLGVRAPDSSSWASGDRLAWGGRSYRVEAAQGSPDPGTPGSEDGPRYVYLTTSEAGARRPAG